MGDAHCDKEVKVRNAVLGNNASVINQTGKFAVVRSFSGVLFRMESVLNIDAAVAYDCPYTLRTRILLVRNALYVPSMQHNLIPPFLMREAELTVNNTPQIHKK